MLNLLANLTNLNLEDLLKNPLVIGGLLVLLIIVFKPALLGYEEGFAAKKGCSQCLGDCLANCHARCQRKTSARAIAQCHKNCTFNGSKKCSTKCHSKNKC